MSITLAKRLSAAEKAEVEMLREELAADGYSFVVADYAVFRVDGQIGIGANELECVFTDDDVYSLDEVEL